MKWWWSRNWRRRRRRRRKKKREGNKNMSPLTTPLSHPGRWVGEREDKGGVWF